MRIRQLAPLALLLLVAQTKPAPLDGMQVFRDLPYVADPVKNSKSQTLDLFLPPDKATPQNPRPLVIWIHGGGWMTGSKAQNPALVFVTQGYAVASVEYRFSQEAIFPAQIQDCKAAVRFLRANAKKYNLDPERFAACGGSAGGHLAALLGTTANIKTFDTADNADESSAVQCVVDSCGPTDFTTIVAQTGPDATLRHDLKGTPVPNLLGGLPADVPALAKVASPITYIPVPPATNTATAPAATKPASTIPPFLIVHGDKDTIVPVEQSIQLHEALQKAGVSSTLQVIKGGGHGAMNAESSQLLSTFFAKHLKVPTQ